MSLHYKSLIPTRTGFGLGVLEAGQKSDNLIALGSDITTSVGMNYFADAFPQRFISLGIAEQNAAGVAAGLALMGKIPVFSTYAVFSALRTTDQIRVSICYNNLHVIIGGAHAGISVGPDGATHQALEDIAVMRCLPNMMVLSPCDATQAKILTEKAISDCLGPVYIRYGREPVPDFTDEDQLLEIGKAQTMKEGKDATIIATGHMVFPALEAAYALSEKGMDLKVVNIHTIKPIDKQAIIDAAKQTGLIVTIEEHQVTGGLGSAVAETVVQSHPVPVHIIGIPDCFGESGNPEELLDKFGLTSEKLESRILQILNDR